MCVAGPGFGNNAGSPASSAFRHERMPAVLEHFNDHKYRTSHNSSDREKNVQQIIH